MPIKLLKHLCFVLNVVLPLTVLEVSVILWDGSELLQVWMILGAIPLTAVYWGILFLNFSPRTKAEMLRMFIPIVLATVFALTTGQGKSLLLGWAVEASAVYTGLNLCFFFGLSHLFWRGAKNAFGALFFLILFAVLMGIPMYFFTVNGVSLFSSSKPWILAFYSVQVLCTVMLFYPKLVKLYLKKKL